MTLEDPLLLTLAVFAVALLYSSVGHAGASGYIAVMSLFGLPPETIRPVALVLNILVASIGAWQFWRAGHFAWRLFWPFAVLSVPGALVGGYLRLPTGTFNVVVGVVLLFSAARMLLRPPADRVWGEPPIPVALGLGAAIGLLSGLTGVGGGVFLSPLLILMAWARAPVASAVSALFILVNSVSGLVGNLSATGHLPAVALPLAAAAVTGGTAGAYVGSRQLVHATIIRLLALVLIVAGLKLLFSG